ncbi:MAG: DUF4065 domain-containing protein [Butyrivibrio sp.]|nr:DUF4065 domain-containing protein [Acetatifactor muris]MCM1561208.1 DUF4065 domain-containing protein [Butyrivibrio sp.]
MGKVILFKRGEERMEDILEVAKYFLSRGMMNHKKLQKLCYYSQALYAALYNTKLMDTEFEAWVHGPVSPRLYSRYRDWGGLCITGLQSIPHFVDGSHRIFLDKIYDLYGGYTADELEKMTHEESPWKEARGNLAGDVPCKNIIPYESMARYYRGMLGVGG